MFTDRRTAKMEGALFLIAMVASLLGGGLVESVLSAPDYLVAMAEHETRVTIGVLLELINGIAVVGIGVLMFPILKRCNETTALGYLALRMVKAVFCCVIVLSPLSLLALSQEYTQAGAVDATYIQMLRMLSVAERAGVASLLIPVFLSLGALLLYSTLYKFELLPRYISAWGFVGAVLILLLNLLLTFNVEVGLVALVFALPIISNEIFLGVWLITKGFNASADGAN